MQLLKNSNRPYHLGRFPLETLPRDNAQLEVEAARPHLKSPAVAPSHGELGLALRRYRDLYAEHLHYDPAEEIAPLPKDLQHRVVDIKGAGYFLNADHIGICALPDNAWFADTEPLSGHDQAIVVLVEHCKVPDDVPLAAEWIAPAVAETFTMRAAGIAINLARHVQTMGFAARAHFAGHSLVDAERLAVMAGVAVRRDNTIVSPYCEQFSLAVVSTAYPLAHDKPLATTALSKAKGLAYWWGSNGAMSGRERNRRARRPSWASRYPMETVKRVERPTTLIIDDEVPRVPKRAAFFERALRGDLGGKAQRERTRFATKHPLSFAMTALIRSMVPLQGGDVTRQPDCKYRDPKENAKAIKALSYFLGADLTGICEVPRYAWYSHKEDGTAIDMYHRYAVVMLIDQEFDTMEGASGDDWISGAQSMRGYQRGAEIAGIMGELLRDLGFPARAQTNLDSDVLQIPLVLLAGLGELSRIGELVLNPFVGPRFKSVVLTTDMPLEVDKPIDFGLQYFCQNCLKCARECPCDAIPFGDKVMFNGYETWKPDAERCTRYRVTNPHGSACGRCMKTCPINKVVDADGPLLTRLASWCGVNLMWAKPLMVPIATWFDDVVGNGKRVASKKWWFDHELVNGKVVTPKGVNQREINPSRKVDPAKQKMAFYPANTMPPGNQLESYPVDRKAAVQAGALLETPVQARERLAKGGLPPEHYRATPPLDN